MSNVNAIANDAKWEPIVLTPENIVGEDQDPTVVTSTNIYDGDTNLNNDTAQNIEAKADLESAANKMLELQLSIEDHELAISHVIRATERAIDEAHLAGNVVGAMDEEPSDEQIELASKYLGVIDVSMESIRSDLVELSQRILRMILRLASRVADFYDDVYSLARRTDHWLQTVRSVTSRGSRFKRVAPEDYATKMSNKTLGMIATGISADARPVYEGTEKIIQALDHARTEFIRLVGIDKEVVRIGEVALTRFKDELVAAAGLPNEMGLEILQMADAIRATVSKLYMGNEVPDELRKFVPDYSNDEPAFMVMKPIIGSAAVFYVDKHRDIGDVEEDRWKDVLKTLSVDQGALSLVRTAHGETIVEANARGAKEVDLQRMTKAAQVLMRSVVDNRPRRSLRSFHLASEKVVTDLQALAQSSQSFRGRQGRDLLSASRSIQSAALAQVRNHFRLSTRVANYLTNVARAVARYVLAHYPAETVNPAD